MDERELQNNPTEQVQRDGFSENVYRVTPPPHTVPLLPLLPKQIATITPADKPATVKSGLQSRLTHTKNSSATENQSSNPSSAAENIRNRKPKKKKQVSKVNEGRCALAPAKGASGSAQSENRNHKSQP